MDKLREQIRGCTACELCKNMPFHPIPGVGPLNAKIMLIGEAPGEDESLIEEPFVGQAGKMLDRLLSEAGLVRKDLYIANLVNCRPVDGKRNRAPTAKEIKACMPWLIKQIEIVRPKAIFTLGRLPTSRILGLKSTAKLQDYIGIKFNRWVSCGNITTLGLDECHTTVIPNYHPSFIMQYGKKEIAQAVSVFEMGLRYLTN